MKLIVYFAVVIFAHVSHAQTAVQSDRLRQILYTNDCIQRLNSQIRADVARNNVEAEYLEFMAGFKVTGDETADRRFSLFNNLGTHDEGRFVGTAHISIASGQCELISTEELK